MALHVLDEANRCLGCKKPLCQQGCPIQIGRASCRERV